MKPKGPLCESCGMPLDQDPQGGGIEADGSKCSEYCSYCYQNGQFTDPDATPEKMQQIAIDAMKEKMRIPKFLGKFMVGYIPKLKRWNRSTNV